MFWIVEYYVAITSRYQGYSCSCCGFSVEIAAVRATVRFRSARTSIVVVFNSTSHLVSHVTCHLTPVRQGHCPARGDHPPSWLPSMLCSRFLSVAVHVRVCFFHVCSWVQFSCSALLPVHGFTFHVHLLLLIIVHFPRIDLQP